MQREWYGFRVESGGQATFTNVTIRDAVHCIPTPANSAESLPDNLTFDNVTLINCGTPPTIAGNPTPEFPEDRTEPVACVAYRDGSGGSGRSRFSVAVVGCAELRGRFLGGIKQRHAHR